jgi:hypothetical protein
MSDNCIDLNTERMHYSTLLHAYNKLATYCKRRSQMVPFLIAGHSIEICWLLHITIATCTYTSVLHATPNYGIVRGYRGSSVVSTATKIVRSRFRNSTCDESTPCYIHVYTSSFAQRESLENVNTSLRILTALAEDCPEETLLRSVKRNWMHVVYFR